MTEDLSSLIISSFSFLVSESGGRGENAEHGPRQGSDLVLVVSWQPLEGFDPPSLYALGQASFLTSTQHCLGLEMPSLEMQLYSIALVHAVWSIPSF